MYILCICKIGVYKCTVYAMVTKQNNLTGRLTLLKTHLPWRHSQYLEQSWNMIFILEMAIFRFNVSFRISVLWKGLVLKRTRVCTSSSKCGVIFEAPIRWFWCIERIQLHNCWGRLFRGGRCPTSKPTYFFVIFCANTALFCPLITRKMSQVRWWWFG